LTLRAGKEIVMPNFVYIACSLDGYIAKPNGNIDWLLTIPNPKNDDYGFSEYMATIDGIIMGRNTFETVLGFPEWPYQKPVFVLSTTLKTVPDIVKGKAEIVSGDIKRIVEDLKKRGFANIYIDGGKTIQSFLKVDLIDGMIITTISKILGEGISLFGNVRIEKTFYVEKVERLNEYMVKTYYKKAEI
jgi:dihydrofolate reductase